MEQEIKTIVAELDVKIKEVENKIWHHRTAFEMAELEQGKKIRDQLLDILKEES